MERLTFEGNFCDISQCRNVPGGSFCEDGACSQKKVWERLKQFEDTVQSPELFFKMYGELPLLDSAIKNYGSHDRMKEIAKADKDGRVVVLPCRQGDELWTYCNHPVKRVYSFTVSDVSTLNGRTVLNTLGLGTIRPEDIGKTEAGAGGRKWT